MELDNIRLDTTWNDAADSINLNFAKIQQALLSSGGGGGLDEASLAQYLTSHGYATQTWVGSLGYVTGTEINERLAPLEQLLDWFKYDAANNAIYTDKNFYSKLQLAAGGVGTGGSGSGVGGGIAAILLNGTQYPPDDYGIIALPALATAAEHDALRSEFDALYKTLNDDTSGVINTWQEVVDFVNEYSGSEDLSTILSKMNAEIATKASETELANAIARIATLEGDVSDLKVLLDWFKIDADGNVYTERNFYSKGQIAAGGVGDEEQGSGVGVLLLNAWPTDSADYSSYALGGNLGVDLNSRVSALEGKATAVSFSQTLTSGKPIGTLTIDGLSKVLYAPATYNWSEITGRPTTLAGYEITDGIIYNRTIKINGDKQPLNEIGYGQTVNGWPANGPALSIGYNQSYWVQVQCRYTAGFWFRTELDGTTSDWSRILDSANYATVLNNVYLPLTGGTVTGFVTIRRTGSEALIIMRDEEVASLIRYSNSAGILGKMGFTSSKEAAIYDENTSYVGKIIHSGNYNSYAPTLTGVGASGTWNIDISGNAKTTFAFKTISRNAEIDLNTALLGGGVACNYYSGISSLWTNAPTGASYGSVIEFFVNSKYNSENSLCGQLLWDVNHNSETDATRYLWWRAADANGFTNSKWHQIAFTDSDITGNAATATKLKNSVTLWGNTFDGTQGLNGNITLNNNTCIGFNYGDTVYNAISFNTVGTLSIGYDGATFRGLATRIYGRNIDFYTANANGTPTIAMSINSAGQVSLNNTIIANGNAMVFKNSFICYWKDTNNTNKNILTYNSGKLLAIGYGITEKGNITGLFGNTINLHAGESRSLAMTITEEGNVGIGDTTPIAPLTVAPKVNGKMELGTANGIVFAIQDQYKAYGINFNVKSTGIGEIQVGRIEGTATAYDLNLNPLGGGVTFGGGKVRISEIGLFLKRDTANYIWGYHENAYLALGAGGTNLSAASSSLCIYANQVIPGHRNGEVALGSTEWRWKNVYSADGDFSTSIKIGTIVLTDENGTLKISGNAYTTGQLAAGAAGSAEEGGAGIGLLFDSTKSWLDYTSDMADYALAAYHGKALNDRLAAVEAKSGDYLPLTGGEISGVLDVLGKLNTVGFYGETVDVDGRLWASNAEIDKMDSSLLPGKSNAYDLGSATLMWSNIYARQASIQTLSVDLFNIGNGAYEFEYDNLGVYINRDKIILRSDLGGLASKDSLAFSDLTATPTTLAGYGITDAKISNGVITIGTQSITPLPITGNAASATKLQTAVSLWGNTFDGTQNLSGSITLDNNSLISMRDTNGVEKHILNLNSANTLLLGYGTAGTGYDTQIFGKKIALTVYNPDTSAWTNALSVAPNGNVLIGTTNDLDYKLRVVGNASFYNKAYFGYEALTCFNESGDLRMKAVSNGGWAKGLSYHSNDESQVHAMIGAYGYVHPDAGEDYLQYVYIGGGASSWGSTWMRICPTYMTLQVPLTIGNTTDLASSRGLSLYINGSAYAAGGLETTTITADKIVLGGKTIEVVNDAVKVDGNFYASGQVAAGGTGQDGSAGSSILLLTSWPTDGSDYSSYALGGNLGVELHNSMSDITDRVNKLEGGANSVTIDMSALYDLYQASGITQAQMSQYGLTQEVVSNMLDGMYTKVVHVDSSGYRECLNYSGYEDQYYISIQLSQGDGFDVMTGISLRYEKETQLWSLSVGEI